MPAGFTATPFATGLVNPRRLLVLPNGDVLVAEQSAGYLTLLRDDGSGHAVWIDRHVEDLNRPYGLAWQGDHVLVADQDGIWSVPHILGALRAGRSDYQRVDQVPPEERKPIAGAYGAKMITQKGVFGIAQGHQNRPLWPSIQNPARCLSASAPRAMSASSPSRRRRSSGSMRTARIRRLTPRACATRPRSHSSRRPATFTPRCRSATASATICPPTI